MIVQHRFFFFFFSFITIILLLGFFSREHFSDIKRLGSHAIDLLKDSSQHHAAVADNEEIDLLPPSLAEPDIKPDIPSSTITEHNKATTSDATAPADEEIGLLPPSLAEAEINPDIPSSTAIEQSQATTDDATVAHDDEIDNFGGEWWFFQDDLHDYENAKFDLGLKSYRPHNYEGHGHETYATFLSTRNSSLHDPYFLATQQIAYRLLWDPRSNSSHPLVVFVAPYISQIQRDHLMAAGAMVRELELIDWQPTHMTTAQPRWREMFSKLNFWKQTDFSRILYLDTDAFPLTHLDELFEIAEEQTCREPVGEACQYVFSAVAHAWGGLNAGLMILKPDLSMHALLMREMHNREEYDQNMVEQAFLDHEFGLDGPFPAQYLERKWNALFTTNEDEGKINVIHEKLWAMDPDHFAAHYFRETWDAMIKLYESEDFVRMRMADGVE